MRIVQLLSTLSYGDGVGNDVLAIDNLLKEHGYETMIYAENIDGRIPKKIVKYVDKMPVLQDDDIVLYHLSTGTKLNYTLDHILARKIIIYHNVTPPEWFAPYDQRAAHLCEDGICGVKYLAHIAEYCIADSDFNKRNLQDMGYGCEIETVPILIPFEDYEQKADAAIVNRYSNDEYTNIIFTGRIAPNKMQEDVIETFYYYKKYYNEKSRLFLVGSYDERDRYYKRLCDYVEQLGVKEVYFTGHIKFNKILAYYNLADLFLCMSEHEGFCIPLVEAMYFGVPILAYGNTAIAETLGGSGICMKDKDPLLMAGIIDKVVTDLGLREKLIKSQKKRLNDFNHAKVSTTFLNCLEKFINRDRKIVK